MVATSDLAQQKVLLTAVRMQLSDDVQTYRRNGLEDVVKNLLYFQKEDEPLSALDVCNKFKSDDDELNLNYSDVRNTLDRLELEGDLQSDPKINRKKFSLTKKARSVIAEKQAQADQRIDVIVDQLFASSPLGSKAYKQVFLEILSKVHARLGKANARIITDRLNGYADQVSAPILDEACTVNGRYQHLDAGLIRLAFSDYLTSNDPRHQELLFAMAQSYFLMEMLGLDPAGTMLSRDLFDNSIFLFDTNVVISALEPGDENHDLFVSLIASLRVLGADLRVSTATIAELDRWVEGEKESYQKVIDAIPDSMLPDVESPIMGRYQEALKARQVPTLDYLFENFSNPIQKLRENFGITIERDSWFNQGPPWSSDLRSDADILRQRTKKSMNVAIHDVKALRWVEAIRKGSQQRAWFITRDRSLPGVRLNEGQHHAFAITIDALLQWISPITSTGVDPDQYVRGYARLVRDQILPRDRYFKFEDFQILADMNIDIKTLPDGDAEKCMRHVRAQLGRLNPADHEHRQDMIAEVNRYFKGPESKSQEIIKRLTDDKELAEQDFEKRMAAKDKTLEKERERAKEERERRESLEQAIQDSDRQKKLRRRGYRWLLLFSAILVLAECAAYWLVVNKIDGQAQLAKALEYSLPFLAPASVWWFAVRSYIGKEKLNAMGKFWSMTFNVKE